MKKILQESLEYINSVQIIRRNYYYNLLQNYVNNNAIFVLTWQRRVWKSYVLLDFLKEKNNFFYFNKELDEYNKIKSNIELADLFNLFLEQNPNTEYIAIDEIQDINFWELFIRKVFTLKKYKIIITWSNSKLLSSELATFLTWRYINFDIFPLSFNEYLDFSIEKNISKKDVFREYCEFGGLPEVYFVDKKYKINYLKTIWDSIILRDIVDRFWVKNISVLEKLSKFLGNTVWSLVSSSNISNYFKTQFDSSISSSIISRYIDFLKIVFLIHQAERYDLKWKRILEYVWKYYFSDIWIRNIFWFNYSFDIWKILENIVFINLKKFQYTVYVWELAWKEVDFVAEKNWEKLYIQVSYIISDEKVAKREFWNLLEIADNYEKIVISLDDTFWNTYEGIKHINIMDFEDFLEKRD